MSLAYQGKAQATKATCIMLAIVIQGLSIVKNRHLARNSLSEKQREKKTNEVSRCESQTDQLMSQTMRARK